MGRQRARTQKHHRACGHSLRRRALKRCRPRWSPMASLWLSASIRTGNCRHRRSIWSSTNSRSCAGASPNMAAIRRRPPGISGCPSKRCKAACPSSKCCARYEVLGHTFLYGFSSPAPLEGEGKKTSVQVLRAEVVVSGVECKAFAHHDLASPMGFVYSPSASSLSEGRRMRA